MRRGLPPLATAAGWAILVIAPIGTMLWRVVAMWPALGASERTRWLMLALPRDERLTNFLRSVALSGSVALLATLLGLVVALALWTVRWRRARWLLLALAPIPPYVHALAWTRVMDRSGMIAALSPGEGVGRGFLGATGVLVMAFLPLAAGLALVGLERVPRDLLDAGKLLRGDGWTVRRIAVPLAAPMLTAAAGLIFALTLLDFSVPALFQVSTHSLAIYADYSAHGSSARATVHSLPLMVAAGISVWLAFRSLRYVATRDRRRGRTEGDAVPPIRWSTPWQTVRLLGLLLVVLQIAVPILGLTMAAGTPIGAWNAVAAARDELRDSLTIGVLSALLAVPLAAGAAEALHRDRPWAWLAVAAPLAVPGPIVAIGLIALWNRPGLAGGLYDSIWMPTFASVARFAPLAALVLLAERRRRDPLLEDAADLFGRRWLRTLWRVRLPMLMYGLLAAAAVVFALSLGELGATLLVAPPGRNTLTMRIYNYLHYGASDAVAGLCLAIVLVIGMAGAVAAAWIGSRAGAGAPTGTSAGNPVGTP